MVGRFFKNVSQMSVGTIVQLLIAILSTAIYIRMIGSSGYAIIGISFALFNLIARIDVPYYLILIKYNKKSMKSDFSNMFNTLLNLVLLSNIAYFIILVPLIFFLSYKVYNRPELLVYYSIGLIIFLLNRIGVFFKEFFRANEIESHILTAQIPSLLVNFVSSLVFLFIFDMGVLSIFIASLISLMIELIILNYFVQRTVQYERFFSKRLLFESFRKFGLKHYSTRLAAAIVSSGGLFISSFYLNTSMFGYLTIFITFMHKLKGLASSLIYYIIPIFSNGIENRNHRLIESVVTNISYLLTIMFIMSTTFLLTIGKPLYLIYFSQPMETFYGILLLIIVGVLFRLSLICYEWYIFAYDVGLYLKVNIFFSVLFLVLLFPLIKLYGIMGVSVTYFVINLLVPFTYYLIFRDVNHVSDTNRHQQLFRIFAVFMTLLYVINLVPITVTVSLMVLIGLTFVFHIKKISNSTHCVLNLDT